MIWYFHKIMIGSSSVLAGLLFFVCRQGSKRCSPSHTLVMGDENGSLLSNRTPFAKCGQAGAAVFTAAERSLHQRDPLAKRPSNRAGTRDKLKCPKGQPCSIPLAFTVMLLCAV